MLPYLQVIHTVFFLFSVYAKIPYGGKTYGDHNKTDGKPLTITIEYPSLDTKTQKLIRKIRTLNYKVSGDRQGTLFQIPISEIYYVESVERKTFFYTKDEVYMADKKLYELEDLLAGTGIVRISKSCLMNVDMLYRVKRLANSQLEATLTNGEKLIVARTYLKSIKDCLKEAVWC